MSIEVMTESGKGSGVSARTAVMTIPRSTFGLLAELQAGNILPEGRYPTTINPHQEVGISIPERYQSVLRVQNALAHLEGPENQQVKFSNPYETVDFYTMYYQNDVSIPFTSRIRIGKAGMRYIFTINTGETAQWSEDLFARVENVLVVMRKFNLHSPRMNQLRDYASLIQFFTEGCSITQIVYKENIDISFGDKLNREYYHAGVIDEAGRKISVTHSHAVNSTGHFLKGVISKSTRAVFENPLNHVVGLGLAASLRNGYFKPDDIFNSIFTPTEKSGLDVDIELRGGDRLRKFGAETVYEIARITGSTDFGVMQRKGSIRDN